MKLKKQRYNSNRIIILQVSKHLSIREKKSYDWCFGIL